MTEQQINRYRLLDEKEFSEITGISLERLRRWRRSETQAKAQQEKSKNTGPAFIKDGKNVRYTLHLYEKWLNENTVSGEDLKRSS